jgi:hypothetical protein
VFISPEPEPLFEQQEGRQGGEACCRSRCSVYLLYWYKSTNIGGIKAFFRTARRAETNAADLGTQFTSFAITKVQTLTQAGKKMPSHAVDLGKNVPLN